MNNIYYIDPQSKQQYGPFSLDELASRGISPEVIVWASGMEDWARAGDVQELSSLFDGSSKKSVSSRRGQINQTLNAPIQRNSNKIDGAYGYNTVQADNLGIYQAMPKTWLPESIIFTAICCNIFGAIGIYYASKVSSLHHAGKYEEAIAASKKAKQWIFIGVGIAILVTVGSVLVGI